MTLLVEEGHYQEALDRTLALKSKLPDGYSNLQTFNDLRVALLQDLLKLDSQSAWQELKTDLTSKRELAAHLKEAFSFKLS